jgi:single-strand DNA-binding protein
MSTGRARAHIIGNLGRDPEMRFTPNGTAVTNFTVAVNHRPRNQNQGGEEPKPDWYRVVCFGRQAETADKVLRRGLRVYVEGRLQINDFTTNEGEERRSVEIVASDFMILTPRDENQGSGQEQRGGGQQYEDDLDDLPF